jgi:putative transposase
MPDYRRAFQPGGTFFFTVVTEGRAPILCTDTGRTILHDAIAECMRTRPLSLDAIILLPDHLHTQWTLPPGDSDFSTRWAAVKSRFTHDWLASGGAEQSRTGSRVWNRRRGVWQRRFWEHWSREEDDRNRHLDYLHYNAVKHGYVTCPHAWPYSTFGKWVKGGGYDRMWLCRCDGRTAVRPAFSGLDVNAIEMGE